MTYARLTAVEPSGSDLVRLTITGNQLTAVLERALAGSFGPTVHLAGAQVRYDPRAAAGKRVRGVVLTGGRKLRAEAEYTLATDEATAGGAGGLARSSRACSTSARDCSTSRRWARYLRRLPQPVEASQPAAFVSTRR